MQAALAMASVRLNPVAFRHPGASGDGMARNSATMLLSSPAEWKYFGAESLLRSSRRIVLLKPSPSVSCRKSRLEHLATNRIWKRRTSEQAMAHHFSQALQIDRWAFRAYNSGRQDGMVEKDGGTLTKGSGDGSVEQVLAQDQAGADGSKTERTGTRNLELEKTQRLVETAMLAATAGLAFFLSNLFRLEGYFGCFFPLPVVISSMRYGALAGRKTMVATTLLLLILSGPLKSASYVLMHGSVGLSIGILWRWRINWFVSLAICTVVRCFGALGFVLLSSWLLRENLLRLITINAHASISYMLSAVGINIIPTMMMIYVIFGILLILNCGLFVFLLHVLYVILLKRLGLETNTSAPRWIQRAA